MLFSLRTRHESLEDPVDSRGQADCGLRQLHLDDGQGEPAIALSEPRPEPDQPAGARQAVSQSASAKLSFAQSSGFPFAHAAAIRGVAQENSHGVLTRGRDLRLIQSEAFYRMDTKNQEGL